ncbi:MAG: sensor signal transduction histidine kinase [Candidatus Aminicenantes bacterium]|nr:sensor signal transduction histidine kinase [Candidatus Aminicenantes bacterium]
MKKTLFLRIFLGYAAVIALLALAVTLFAPPAMRKHHIAERASNLEQMALLLEGQIAPFLTGSPAGDLEGLVTSYGRRTGTRITVIDAAGVVLADSEKEPRDMENHLFRPEIQASLRGEKQMSIRPSSTLKTEMMYMSIPVSVDGRVKGALRLSYFMKDLDALMESLRGDLLKVVGLVTLLALVLAIFLTRSVTGPLREVIDASSKVAAGDFDVTVSTRRSGEFRGLARSFNAMTGKLKDMFGEIRLQSEEIGSILASIREGLCVLDGDARIVLCNAGFRRIAGNDAPEGRHFWEVVRSSAAAEVVRKVRETGAEAASEAAIGDRTYYLNVARLAVGDRIVVTLHDVTEFRALEKTKRDFAVNVSHELKTPLTAIKGFVETMEPRAEEENKPYLEIIRRNTDRLIAIVEDLLVLSQIEDRGQKLEKSDLRVKPLAENILRVFEKRAREKGLTLSLEAPPDLPSVKADPLQVEGLLLNLVDNAVKYTEKGTVTVRLLSKQGRFVIEVADTGLGIEAAHLPHIFERFYVADKSRSKKLGGTGLGLSIVKHMVMAHDGTVSVASRVGEGTTFTVSLPLG